MSRLGLWACLSVALGAAGAQAAPAARAGECKPRAPKPAADKPFGIESFGEVPGEPLPISPDTGDFNESCSNPTADGAAQGAKPSEPAAPAPNPPAPPTQAGPSAPAAEPVRPEGPPTPPAIPASGPIAVPGAAPAPAAAHPAPAAAAHWSWPGPESPAGRSHRAAQEPSRVAQADAEAPEALRDAPAALPADRYSLWAGLSQPLLMPASKARELPLDRAKTLGDQDYASHILAQAAVNTGGATLGSARPKPLPATRQRVSVELDVADHPGEWRQAAGELGAGFAADPAAQPRFLGVERRRVVVSGTVDAERTAELLASPRLKRLESSFGAAPAAAAGETRLLVGLRIPPEGSPLDILREAAARLAARASFTLERPVAYQRIPGTSQMVVVAAGRLPVRSVGALLSDPAVVKVAPSPSDASPSPAPGAPSAPAWKRLLHLFVHERPGAFLALVLITTALLGPTFRRTAHSK